MTVLFWVLVSIFSLNWFSGLYYAINGGYELDKDVRVAGAILNLGLLAWLLIVVPTTWFGWVLVGVFSLGFVTSVLRISSPPVWKTTENIVWSMVFTSAALAALIVVGI